MVKNLNAISRRGDFPVREGSMKTHVPLKRLKRFPWRSGYRRFLRLFFNLTGIGVVALAVYTSLVRADNHPTQDFWTCASHVSTLQNIFDQGEGWFQAIGETKIPMPYEIGLGWGASVFNWTPSRILRLAEMVNILLLAAGLGVFGRRWTSTSTPWGGPVAVALLFWGRGFYQTTEYHLALLPLVGHYHTTFSFALALFSLTLLADFCRSQSFNGWRVYGRLVGAAFLGAGVALCHSITSFFFLIPMAVITVLFRSHSRRQRLYGLLFFPAMFLTVMLWPWREVAVGPMIQYIQSEQNGETGGKVESRPPVELNSSSASPQEPARSGGLLERIRTKQVTFNPGQYKVHFTLSEIFLRAPALKYGWFYLVVLMFLRPRKREVRAIALAIALLLAGWAFSGYVLKLTQGGRFLYFLGFLLQLATIRALWDLTAAPRWKWVLSLPLLCGLYVPVHDCIEGYRDNFCTSKTLIRLPADQLAEIRKQVRGEKVLGDLETLNYLPAFDIQPAWLEREYGLVAPQLAPVSLQNWWACPLDGKGLTLAARESGANWLLFDKQGLHDLKQLHAGTRPFFQSLYSRSSMLEPVYESDVYRLYRIRSTDDSSGAGNIAILQAIEEAQDLFQWESLHSLYANCVEKDSAILEAFSKKEQALLQSAPVRGVLVDGIEVVGFKWTQTQPPASNLQAEYRGTWLLRITKKPDFKESGKLNIALFGKVEPEYQDWFLQQGNKKPEFGFTLANLPYQDWQEGAYYTATRLFPVPAIPYRLYTNLGFDSGSGSKQIGVRVDLGLKPEAGD